jgi:hypothetical protein
MDWYLVAMLVVVACAISIAYDTGYRRGLEYANKRLDELLENRGR